MARSRTHFLSRLAVVSLLAVAALPMSAAHSDWHGGGGGWHGGGWGGGGWHGGGGGWGWHGGGWGWGWGPGIGFGFVVPPFYYPPPPPAYYYPPPAYYPPPGYYPPYPQGYMQGYYGGAVQRPYYANPAATDPNNCGTPDEPRPCRY